MPLASAMCGSLDHHQKSDNPHPVQRQRRYRPDVSDTAWAPVTTAADKAGVTVDVDSGPKPSAASSSNRDE
jgi:hypothetical protein